jgi:hypothetical protein
MERDYREYATRVEFTKGKRERIGECPELIVHRNPNPLESPGGRMRATGTRGGRGGFGDQFGEGGSAGEAPRTAGGDDGVHNAIPTRLFPVIADRTFNLGTLAAFEELGGAPTRTRIHAHIVRSVEAERETAFRDIQLVRGHPNVHQNTVESPRNAVKVAEIFRMEMATAHLRASQGGETLGRGWIPIHRIKRAVRGTGEERRGVTTAPERAIQIGTAVLRSKECHALLKQNWNVAGHQGKAL